MNHFAKRIIPCLDVKNGRVVKGVNFVGLQDAGNPIDVAKRYNEEGADEITFLDISASHLGEKTIIDVIREVAKELFIPLTVGGGIRTIENITELLNAGCDKVSLNSTAIKNPNLIDEAAKKFGSQCVVVAVDTKSLISFEEPKLKIAFKELLDIIALANNSSQKQLQKLQQTLNINQYLIDEILNICTNFENIEQRCIQISKLLLSTKDGIAKKLAEHIKLGLPKQNVFINGGRINTQKDTISWIKECYDRGAGEILLTSMDTDGTKNGYDLITINAVNKIINIPIIASGGAGEMKHILDAFTCGADAALAASIFHFREIEIMDLKKFLKQNDIEVRL